MGIFWTGVLPDMLEASKGSAAEKKLRATALVVVIEIKTAVKEEAASSVPTVV